jgi:hypothetical protein
MVENISTTFRCNICNKNYKDKSGIWYHNKKYHGRKSSDESLKTSDKENKSSDESLKTSDKENKISEKNINNYECTKCHKNFNNRKTKWSHEKKCNNIIDYKLLFEKEEKEKNELKLMFEKQIIEIKNQLIETMNKNCKVHPKTLQKINKQLNCNNMVKNTNNITYNIIGLGHENLTEVFSRKEKMAILKNRFYCLPDLVEYTHFNDKYPQFKNILITNTQNTLAYKYDSMKKQFLAVNKDELLDDIVDERMCDINSFYEELENDLDEKTKEIIEKVIDKIENDPAYKELKKKDIKLIIYNNRKKVVKDNLLEDEFEV